MRALHVQPTTAANSRIAASKATPASPTIHCPKARHCTSALRSPVAHQQSNSASGAAAAAAVAAVRQPLVCRCSSEAAGIEAEYTSCTLLSLRSFPPDELPDDIS